MNARQHAAAATVTLVSSAVRRDEEAGMAERTETIARAIQATALAAPDAERRDVERAAAASTLFNWRRAASSKLGAVGCLTGFLGGLWAVVGDAGETSMVIGQARRACHGIGHILRRDVDYDADMALVLAVWAGAAAPARTPVAGKVVVETGRRSGAADGGEIAAPLVARSALRGPTGAFAERVARWAAAKIAAEKNESLPMRWMPMMVAMASAAVNAWVLEGLMDAAEKVYSTDYVVLHDDLGATLEVAPVVAAARAA
jgi:hypothetical protein